MTESNDETHATNPIGSAAEEALKLFDAVQQRVGRELGKGLVKGGMSGFGAAFGSTGGGARTDDVWSEAVAESHDEEYICRACPVLPDDAAQREHARAPTSPVTWWRPGASCSRRSGRWSRSCSVHSRTTPAGTARPWSTSTSVREPGRNAAWR